MGRAQGAASPAAETSTTHIYLCVYVDYIYNQDAWEIILAAQSNCRYWHRNQNVMTALHNAIRMIYVQKCTPVAVSTAGLTGQHSPEHVWDVSMGHARAIVLQASKQTTAAWHAAMACDLLTCMKSSHNTTFTCLLIS
jgi:hypothetical protein